jgi:hypothetical protein
MSNADLEYQSAANQRVHEARMELRRQLRLRGIPEERADKLIREHGPKIEAERKTGGPQLRVHVGYGHLLGQAGIDALVNEISQAEQLLTHGPDPAEMMVERLVGGGVPLEEARSMARRTAWRERDGQISVRDNQRQVFTRGDTLDLDRVAQQLVRDRDASERANSPELQTRVDQRRAQDVYYVI